MDTISTDDIITLIKDRLQKVDGITLEDIARNLGIESDYQGDSMFVVPQGTMETLALINLNH